jgi:hypothetical protein
MRIRERSRRSVPLTLLLVLLLCLASFAAQCNRRGNSNKAVNNSNVSAGDSEKDREVDDLLRSKIRQNLTERSNNSNTGLSALDIEVSVSKRKVGLSGAVKSEAARSEAERIARETEVERQGEKFKAAEVDTSKLTVKPASP